MEAEKSRLGLPGPGTQAQTFGTWNLESLLAKKQGSLELTAVPTGPGAAGSILTSSAEAGLPVGYAVIPRHVAASELLGPVSPCSWDPASSSPWFLPISCVNSLSYSVAFQQLFKLPALVSVTRNPGPELGHAPA